jgi:hypothetical protein
MSKLQAISSSANELPVVTIKNIRTCHLSFHCKMKYTRHTLRVKQDKQTPVKTLSSQTRMQAFQLHCLKRLKLLNLMDYVQANFNTNGHHFPQTVSCLGVIIRLYMYFYFQLRYGDVFT